MRAMRCSTGALGGTKGICQLNTERKSRRCCGAELWCILDLGGSKIKGPNINPNVVKLLL